MLLLRITFRRFFCKKSFTLIEILLVVLLLGIVAGLIIPNFSRTFTNIQLKETAKNIAFLMQYAQNQAIVKKRDIRLVFNPEKSKYWIEQQVIDEEGGHSPDTYERISGRFGRTVNIPPEITIDIEHDRITFYPDGRIEKTRLYLSNEHGRHFTVSTKEQTGYVQVFDTSTAPNPTF